MRYRQFKLSEDEIQALRPVVSPTKVEDDVDQNLDIIATAAENAKEENPSIYKKIQSQLEKLQQKAKQLLSNQGKEESVEEDVAVATSPIEMIIANIKQTIDAMCGGQPINVCKNPDAMALQKDISALEQAIPEQIKQEREAGKEEQKQNFTKYKKGLNSKVVQLVKKAEGLKPETELDRKTMSAVQSSISAKLKQIIEQMEEEGGSPDTINKFLDLAIDGKVIDMKGLVAAKKGKIDDHINKKLPADIVKLFNEEIKSAFFGFIPGGTTAGNYGPAEVGLAILGNPAKKADDGGDLLVGTTKFELKGSGYKGAQVKDPTKGSGLYGARLNSKGIGPGTAGWDTLDEEIKKIMPKIQTVNLEQDPKNSGESKKGYLRYMRASKVKGKIKYKTSSRYNFNGKGLNAINDEILIPNGKEKDTRTLLSNVLKKIINGWKKVDNWEDNIKKMVDPDGSINPKKFNYYFAALAYDSYNKEDKVENILFVNSWNRNYYLIGTQEQLLQAITDGDVAVTGGITWNDDQQKATPQYARA